ncbi:GAF domain-containing protein [Actinokineospora sp. NPDC004072]
MSHTTGPTETVSNALAEAATEDGELLTSIVRVARTIFGAAASSVFLFDAEADELVFEAVSGEGEGFLVGTRFPADRGIAGWVITTGQAMSATELTSSQVFARDLAESTGYVPDSIMAAPIVHQMTPIGVLQVLDPHPQSRYSVADLDLLAMFANQAALSLHILIRNRAARAGLRRGGAEYDTLAKIAALLGEMDDEQRGRGVQLIESLHGMLAGLVR